MDKHLIEYIPILTTLFSIYFLYEIIPHYRRRKKPYLLWWAIGVLTFALGTLTESINALWGWSELNTRIWYIVGALLGGYPLAQGSIYLLMGKKFADWSAWIVVTLILIASVCVFAAPFELPPDFQDKLTGKVLGWQWVRYFSPFINLYALVFLVGGAFYSAVKYKRSKQAVRYMGNIFIAVGALLPGIGGSFTRAGYVNVLFVTEFAGLLMIFYGYQKIRQDKSLQLNSTSKIPVAEK